MSLLQADLPSEDEADDDYDPSKDKTGDEAGTKGRQTGIKRRRGSTAYPEASVEDEPDTEPAFRVAEDNTSANALAKDKADHLWSQLNKAEAKAPPVKATEPGTELGTASAQEAPSAASSKQPFNLSNVCRPISKKQKAGSDTVSCPVHSLNHDCTAVPAMPCFHHHYQHAC